jgi:hypothetical protein
MYQPKGFFSRLFIDIHGLILTIIFKGAPKYEYWRVAYNKLKNASNTLGKFATRT